VLTLPATRRQAWEMYADLRADCERPGAPVTWFDVERWAGRNDLFYLLARLLRRPDINNDWLFERCREVQADPDNHLDLWSRGHYKSTIQTFGNTIREVLNNPNVTIGVFSHTRPIAKGFLVQIKREFEDNEALKQLYSDILWAAPQKEAPRWSEDGGIIVKRAVNPKESTVEAWGLVDGQPTSKHFNVLLFDDVVTLENVTTPEQIEKTTSALELAFNLGAKGARKRFIGTRYAMHDTYSTLLGRDMVTPRLYPATHNGRFEGSPVFLSPTEWAGKLRDMSRKTIAAQLLQNPMADDAATFRAEWLRAYEVRPRTMNVYITCDPSRGRSATSDSTAIAVIGIASSGAKFLLDGACHRMTLSQRWGMLRTLYWRWAQTPGVQHVSVGYERFGAQSDDEYFQEAMRVEAKTGRGGFFSIEELSWPREGGNSKRERIERLEPEFRNGRFFIPAPVLHDGVPSVWRVETDPDAKDFGVVHYSPSRGLTRQQMDAVEGGVSELVARAIIQRDQSLPGERGGRYDLTVKFIQDFAIFPYGRHDDLMDAMSRIYDLDPRAPAGPAGRNEVVNVYSDGV
jgi:hypothetical protein